MREEERGLRYALVVVPWAFVLALALTLSLFLWPRLDRSTPLGIALTVLVIVLVSPYLLAAATLTWDVVHEGGAPGTTEEWAG